jgi:hypothetical protein
MNAWQKTTRVAVVLSLAWLTECSRQVAVPGSSGIADRGQLPFDRVSDNSGISPTAGFNGDRIPAGTEVTIRLPMALSSKDSRPGDLFQAVLDEPLLVAGKTVAPQGTPVTGSVVAARASASLNDPGYLRLTLAFLVVNGKSVPLQTSSIFARGGSYEKRRAATINRSVVDDKSSAAEADLGSADRTSIHPAQGDVRFSTGRRLTFRLAQPLHLLG